jgi:hypothetical protein
MSADEFLIVIAVFLIYPPDVRRIKLAAALHLKFCIGYKAGQVEQKRAESCQPEYRRQNTEYRIAPLVFCFLF